MRGRGRGGLRVRQQEAKGKRERAALKANRTGGDRTGRRWLAGRGGRGGTGGQRGECTRPEEDGEPEWRRGSPKGEKGRKIRVADHGGGGGK